MAKEFESDCLDLTIMNALLKTNQIGRSTFANEVWDELDSTNNRASQLAADGAPHGIIIAARRQTAGRGRQGRTWISPKDAGLYISFLLRPEIPLTSLPLISLATGTAVARSLSNTCGVKVGLKWVNDVVYEGKKLGGILAEMPNNKSLIIGIGINLRHVDRTEELTHLAISVEDVVGAPIDPNILASELAFQIESGYSLLCKGERGKIIDEWKSCSVTLGKEIRAIVAGEHIEGIASDINHDGSLVVETPTGERTLHAGEISIRLADGNYA